MLLFCYGFSCGSEWNQGDEWNGMEPWTEFSQNATPIKMLIEFGFFRKLKAISVF
jgi:hypothetical protein